MSSLVFLQMCKLRPRDDGLITFTFLRFALSGGFLRFSGILIVGQLLIITSIFSKDWCSGILLVGQWTGVCCSPACINTSAENWFYKSIRICFFSIICHNICTLKSLKIAVDVPCFSIGMANIWTQRISVSSDPSIDNWNKKITLSLNFEVFGFIAQQKRHSKRSNNTDLQEPKTHNDIVAEFLLRVEVDNADPETASASPKREQHHSHFQGTESWETYYFKKIEALLNHKMTMMLDVMIWKVITITLRAHLVINLVLKFKWRYWH